MQSSEGECFQSSVCFRASLSYKQGEHLLPCSRAGIFQLQRFTVFPHSKVYGGLFHLDLLKVHAYRERNFVNKFVC